MGGALALKLAARNPRITKVLTSSSVGAPYPIPSALDRFWAATTDKSQLRAAMMEMVHDANAVTYRAWHALLQPNSRGFADL